MKRDKELVARYVIIALSLCGLFLSMYLLRLHADTSSASFCDINTKFNCDAVNKSAYSVLFGVPIALFGVLHYLLCLVLALVPNAISQRLGISKRLLYLFLFLELCLGVVMSGYFTFLEAYVILVYCPLCLASAAITIVNCAAAGYLWKAQRG